MGLPAEFSRAGDSIRANDFNANVSAVRAAQIMDSAGMMISCNPMGGTTISPVPQRRMIRSKVEYIIAPFTLRVVNEGTKNFGSSCMTVGGFPLHKFAWPLFYGLLSRSSGPRNFD